MGKLAPSRLDELKKRYEENPRRFFAPLANEYRKSGDLDQAIALCQEHLEGQPGNMNGHVVYGQALFDSGRYDESQVTFTAALGLDPENLIALRHLGDIARLGNDAAVAVDWYKRVLDADPRNQEILAFIEELKLASPPPAPAPPAPESAPRPSTGAVPTIEIEATSRASLSATPTLAIPRVSAPQKRPSLMDISIDLGMPVDAEAHATPVTGTIPTVPPPAAPRLSTPTPLSTTPAPMAAEGDLEFGNLDFGEPAHSAQMRESMAEAHAPDEPFAMSVEGPLGLETTDPLPAAEATEMNSSLGWEMPGDINLDAPPADGGSTPGQSAPVGDTPQVFVTETMAELYLQQGFRDEALQVYRQLAEQNPGDKSLWERIKNLEGGGRGSMSLDAISADVPDFAPGTDSLVPMSEERPAAPDVSIDDLAPAGSELAGLELAGAEPVAAAPGAPAPAGLRSDGSAIVSARVFFAALAARRALRADGSAPSNGAAAPTPAPTPAVSTTGGSIDGLFGAVGSGGVGGTSDDAIGLALATAVGQGEAGAAIRGRPTQAAASELSLDSVFRGDASLRSSGPVARQSSVLKFDQFFAADEAAAPAAPTDAAAQPAAPGDAAPADDAQFQSWLKGLKAT